MFEVPVDVAPRASQHVAAFRTLEAWSFAEIFQRRACVMQSVPFIMKAAYRGAMRVGREELNCRSRVSRGWKLFFLVPRLLMFRSERGARPEEAVGRPFPALPFLPVVRVVGKQHVPRSGGPPNLIPTSTPCST